ncbi:hypothetical protein [Amnibacterium endophyticum]|uniref:Phosphotyrosine protein phosphatase I domain-containing protein n=1 Tax=Amnibacterium endophyticum TaxID=2109337 RepID=A0ABW4LB77_9MICO
MGTVLVVDGSDVCRAPIVSFVLQERLAGAATSSGWTIETRGLTARPGATMCEGAAGRLGWSGAAIAYYGSHRARPLGVHDVADAALILTAERSQRSSVVRMVPGTQARVFTWKEALVLASVLADRVRNGVANPPADLPALAAALHAARGTVPLIEPAVRTGPFHWRRAAEPDVLSVADGHAAAAQHKHVTLEAHDLAGRLGARITELLTERVPAIAPAPERRPRRRRLLA